MPFEDYYQQPGTYPTGQKQQGKASTLAGAVNAGAGSVCPTCGNPLNASGVPLSLQNNPFVFVDNYGVQPNGTDVFPG